MKMACGQKIKEKLIDLKARVNGFRNDVHSIIDSWDSEHQPRFFFDLGRSVMFHYIDIYDYVESIIKDLEELEKEVGLNK